MESTQRQGAVVETTEHKNEDVHVVLKKQRNVTWAENTVNNENMGRKKSKRCCIYSKPRRYDESDTESESSHSHSHSPSRKCSHGNNDKKKENKSILKSNGDSQVETERKRESENKNQNEEKEMILSKVEKHVKWDQNTVDNEFMNRKKSNRCCIYSKPRRYDESDTESESDSHSHSSDNNDNNNNDDNEDDINNKINGNQDGSLQFANYDKENIKQTEKKNDNASNEMHKHLGNDNFCDNESNKKRKSSENVSKDKDGDQEMAPSPNVANDDADSNQDLSLSNVESSALY